jgi:hypothetical protein
VRVLNYRDSTTEAPTVLLIPPPLTGAASFVLALVPLIGMLSRYLLHAYIDEQFGALIVCYAGFSAPVGGLVLGVASLKRFGAERVLGCVGLLLSSIWLAAFTFFTYR